MLRFLPNGIGIGLGGAILGAQQVETVALTVVSDRGAVLETVAGIHPVSTGPDPYTRGVTRFGPFQNTTDGLEVDESQSTLILKPAQGAGDLELVNYRTWSTSVVSTGQPLHGLSIALRSGTSELAINLGVHEPELLDYRTGRRLRTLPCPRVNGIANLPSGVKFSSDGSLLFLWTSQYGSSADSFSRLIVLSALDNYSPIPVSVSGIVDIGGLAVSRTGRLVAIGGAGRLLLIDFTDLANPIRKLFSLPRGVVSAMTFSPDDRRLAMGLEDQADASRVIIVSLER